MHSGWPGGCGGRPVGGLRFPRRVLSCGRGARSDSGLTRQARRSRRQWPGPRRSWRGWTRMASGQLLVDGHRHGAAGSLAMYAAPRRSRTSFVARVAPPASGNVRCGGVGSYMPWSKWRGATVQSTLRRLFPRHWLLVPVAALLAILLAPPIAHAGDDRESERTGFDWEAFRARTSAQIKGVAADWTGSVAGDVSRSLEGTARLRFFETGNGRIKIAFYLGDTHAYYDGITIGGLISCGTGSRRYPVWVRRKAYEQQPPGRLEVNFTESQAIASKRAGVTPTPRDD